MAGAVGVEPAGAAVARRPARQRVDELERVGVEAGTGHLPGPPPAAVVLADDERAQVVRAAGVGPGGGAVTRRPARHLLVTDRGIAADVERRQGRDRLRGAPAAVCLADDERLHVARGVGVISAAAAVARRGARHRGDVGIPAGVERRQAGHFPSGAPGTAWGAGPGRRGGASGGQRGGGPRQHYGRGQGQPGRRRRGARQTASRHGQEGRPVHRGFLPGGRVVPLSVQVVGGAPGARDRGVRVVDGTVVLHSGLKGR